MMAVNKRKSKKTPPEVPALSSGSAASNQVVANGGLVHYVQEHNAVFFETLRKKLAVITDNLPDVEKMAAVDIFEQDGHKLRGTQVAFNEAHLAAAMKERGEYQCGASIFNINMYHSSTPGMPISEKSVRKLMPMLKQNGKYRCPFRFHVAYSPHFVPKMWKLISPAEPLYAMIFTLAEAIEEGGDIDELVALALGATVVFEEMSESDDSLYQRAISLREQVITSYTAMAPTAFKRLCDLWHWKCVQERVHGHQSNKKLEQAYKAELSADTEPYTASFMEAAFTVCSRALDHRPIFQMMADMDEKLGHKAPMADSVYKVSYLVSKSGNKSLVLWNVQCLRLWQMKGYFGGKQPSAEALGKGSRGTCLPDVWGFQHKLLRHMLDVLLPKLKPTVEQAQKIREVFADHQAVVASGSVNITSDLGLETETKDDDEDELDIAMDSKDLTWLASMSPALRKFVSLAEAAVYLFDFENAIRRCLKQSQPESELFTSSQQGREMWNDCLAAVAPDPAPQAPPSSASQAAGDVAADDLDDALLAEAGEAEPNATQVNNDGSDAWESGAAAESTWQDDDSMEPGAAPAPPAGMSDDEKKRFRKLAARLVAEHVKIVEEPVSEPQLVELLKESYVFKQGTDNKHQLLIYFEPAKCGEPITRPKIRKAAFHEQTFKKILRAVVKLRSVNEQSAGDIAAEGGDDQWELKPNDVFVTVDNGKHGLNTRMSNAFKDNKLSQLKVSQTIITLDYNSALLRKSRAGPSRPGSVEQWYIMQVITHRNARWPEKERKEYAYTNLASVLGPVILPGVADIVQFPFAMKRQLYGRHRRAVGGKSLEDDDSGGEGADDDAQVRSDDALEPFNFHALPKPYYAAVISDVWADKVFDFNVSSGEMAIAAMEMGISYLGLACTKEHAKAIYSHLVDQMLTLMKTSTSPSYSPAYAAALSGTALPLETLGFARDDRMQEDDASTAVSVPHSVKRIGNAQTTPAPAAAGVSSVLGLPPAAAGPAAAASSRGDDGMDGLDDLLKDLADGEEGGDGD